MTGIVNTTNTGWLSVTLTWLSNFKSVSFRVFAEMPTEEGSNAIKFIISRAILNLNSVRGVRILPSNFKFELEHEKGNSTVPACYMWLLVLHQQVHRRSYPSLYAFLSPFPTGSVLSIASSSVVSSPPLSPHLFHPDLAPGVPNIWEWRLYQILYIVHLQHLSKPHGYDDGIQLIII